MPVLDTVHARIAGPLVIIGFGSIGRAPLPLNLRHVEVARFPEDLDTSDALQFRNVIVR